MTQVFSPGGLICLISIRYSQQTVWRGCAAAQLGYGLLPRNPTASPQPGKIFYWVCHGTFAVRLMSGRDVS